MPADTVQQELTSAEQVQTEENVRIANLTEEETDALAAHADGGFARKE